MLELVILIALFVSAAMFCLHKWGALDWYTVYRKKWMPDADCYFCLSFWFSLPGGLVTMYVKGLEYAATPFMVAALSAFILAVIIQPKQV